MDQKPTPRCGNCTNFDGAYCTALWNNMDESYKDVYRDSRDPDDAACEYYGYFDWGDE